jgi:hypothetical protein
MSSAARSQAKNLLWKTVGLNRFRVLQPEVRVLPYGTFSIASLNSLRRHRAGQQLADGLSALHEPTGSGPCGGSMKVSACKSFHPAGWNRRSRRKPRSDVSGWAFRDYARFARLVGCACIGMWPGGGLRGQTLEQAIEHLAESFREAGKIAGDLGLTAAFEIEPPFVFNREEHLQHILAGANHPSLKVIYDPSHFDLMNKSTGVRTKSPDQCEEHRLCAINRHRRTCVTAAQQACRW